MIDTAREQYTRLNTRMEEFNRAMQALEDRVRISRQSV